MAQKALDAWKKGDVVFYPQKWENTYAHWMNNIRDWCISRQLWWAAFLFGIAPIAKKLSSIRIYNVYGTEVAQATDTNSIDVSHLPAGVYMVHADGKVARIIKKTLFSRAVFLLL